MKQLKDQFVTVTYARAVSQPSGSVRGKKQTYKALVLNVTDTTISVRMIKSQCYVDILYKKCGYSVTHPDFIKFMKDCRNALNIGYTIQETGVVSIPLNITFSIESFKKMNPIIINKNTLSKDELLILEDQIQIMHKDLAHSCWFDNDNDCMRWYRKYIPK